MIDLDAQCGTNADPAADRRWRSVVQNGSRDRW
jgi:hypothetical protein